MQECIPEAKSVIDSFDWKILIAVLSPLVAAMAIITNYFLIKRQIYSNLLANERKEWINTLRIDVANFASSLITVISSRQHFKQSNSDSNYIIYRDSLSTACMVQTKIPILLNPTDETQKELNAKIERIVDLLTDENINEAETQEFVELSNSLVPLTQKIIGQGIKEIKKLI